MPILIDLDLATRQHWLLHLTAADIDLPALKDEIRAYVRSTAELPNIRHPAYIHDWLEHPEWRTIIEAWNG